MLVSLCHPARSVHKILLNGPLIVNQPLEIIFFIYIVRPPYFRKIKQNSKIIRYRLGL